VVPIFGRRLLEGLEFPLVLLSVPLLLAVWDLIRERTGRQLTYRRVLTFFLILTLFLPSTLIAVARNVSHYRTNSPAIFFLDRDEEAALSWIAGNSAPSAVFLGEQKASHSIVGLAGRRVYVGHLVNTIDFEKKRQEMLDFYAVMGEAERGAFLASRGIEYVYYGPEERLIGIVSATASLRPAASFGSITIFRFEPAPGIAASGL